MDENSKESRTERGRGQLKKFYIILIFGSLALFGMLLFGLIDQPRPRLIGTVNPHAILETMYMEIVWERQDIYVDRGYDFGPSLMAKNNHIFFIGNLEPKYPNYGFVLNAVDGQVISKTEAVGETFSFTVDDIAFYIGTNQGPELYKYDYQNKNKVWSRKMSVEKAPCCFRISNGDLITNWYRGFYRFSASDGTLIEERLWQGTFFYMENGIYYLTTSNGLWGIDSFGNETWDANIHEEINYPPIFTNDRVFIRTDREQGSLYVVNRKPASLLWKGEWIIISNVAVSPKRVYFLTADGFLLGVNAADGEIETSIQFATEYFYDTDRNQNNNYHVAYDDSSSLVFLLLGDSAQLIAIRETR